MKLNVSSNPQIKRLITTRNGAFEINGGFKEEIKNQQQGVFQGKPLSTKEKLNKNAYENSGN